MARGADLPLQHGARIVGRNADDPASGCIESGRWVKKMEIPDARLTWRDEEERLAELCAGVLAEARRLVVREIFGTALAQLLARASDILDRIDETLVALDPERDSRAFARAAALHREFEAVQARVPVEYRGLQRGTRRPGAGSRGNLKVVG